MVYHLSVQSKLLLLLSPHFVYGSLRCCGQRKLLADARASFVCFVCSVCTTYMNVASRCYEIPAESSNTDADIQEHILQCACTEEFFDSTQA